MPDLYEDEEKDAPALAEKKTKFPRKHAWL
jgi:hypothetical protein